MKKDGTEMKENTDTVKSEMRFKCLSASDIKLIAVITMTIDHIGAALLPQYLFLRIIGRLAFPVYCYMIVNGLFYTKNCGKYVLRLLMSAFVSEVFFDLAFYGEVINKNHQNVFFTLAIGLGVIALIEKLRLRYGMEYTILVSAADIIIVTAGCFLAYLMKTDYSFYGVLMIYGFYSFRFNAVISCVFQVFINMILGGVQIFAILSLVPICMYNGEKGKLEDKAKWLFYVYYPIHLGLIFVIKKTLF